MYCNNCGNEIAEGSKFCSQCGTPVTPQAPVKPEPAVAEKAVPAQPVKKEAVKNEAVEDETKKKPFFEEINWNIEGYPGQGAEKTEDINFDWNANPKDIPDTAPRYAAAGNAVKDQAEKPVKQEPVLNTAGAEKTPSEENRPLSAADRIDKFYTFNRKNEEFQQLLNREYEKVKSGNAIEHEISEAEQLANRRFEERPEDSSMEAFLEKEGIVKPYQPKAFESDVLERIEAQEAQKAAKRAEEEARLAAIEEARKQAEAEAQKKAMEEAQRAAEAQQRAREEAERAAEEEARKQAEEIARLAAEEEARKQAEETARLAAEEEARKLAEAKAAEEARIRAEEEARLKAEEEARLKAEAEEKVRAAEEARLKAEADLKAAQEAAKIKAQQEARMAAEAEAQFRANQERKRLEALEAQRRLEEERRKIDAEANQAVAEEEVRKVIEQTMRMRDEEAAKIKEAVAAMRDGIDNIKEDAVRQEVAEAHQATKDQIDEMAKARDAYFAELEKEPAEEKQPEEEVQEVKDISQIMDDSNEAPQVTGRETMLSDNNIDDTRVVDKSAVLAGISDDTKVASRKSAPAPASDEEFFESLDAAAEARPIDFREYSEKAGEPETDDLLLQFESINQMEDSKAEAPEVPENNMENTIQANDLSEAFPTEKNPGLDDTVIMKGSGTDKMAANDFDSYGNEEAANYIKQQNMKQQEYGQNSAMDDFYSEDEAPLSRKEMKRREKEQKRLEKERAKEEKILSKRDAEFDNIKSRDAEDSDSGKGGKGRLALKIILVVLIVILAVEVVGMGIRFIAPQSKAAEFIDNQLNKVIQLITGDDTEYSVIAAQVRTSPMEDKTDLINAQMDKNKNDNIKSIVYSSDLGYDQERDGKVSDLVLSQPMTQVEWGRDEDNYPVYYDEQVVGEIIAFESQLYNLRNKGNEEVLDMIEPDSTLYDEVKALKNQKTEGTFDKLEIGEIRQAGSNYYVWVRETIGNNTAEKVYSMFPEKQFVMKMTTCYEV